MRYRLLNTKKKQWSFFYQFQFRELFIFDFIEMIKSQCFYRFSLTSKNLEKLLRKSKAYREMILQHVNKIWQFCIIQGMFGLLTFWAHRWMFLLPERFFFLTLELLETLRWIFGTVNKIAFGIFFVVIKSFWSFCPYANDLF